MKKMMLMGLLVILILFFCVDEVSAKARKYRRDANYLNVSFLINPAGIGYMHHFGKNFYFLGNLDYRHEYSDLEFRAGGAYLFPVKILIFRFYSGAGMQFSRNDGYQYPFVMIGTKFLFLYTEMYHPMEKGLSPEYRAGISIKF